MPEISVLIPAFRPRYLDLAIASVLAQTFRDFELILSDDSDGDDVENVTSKWPDPRIRYVRNPRRQEPGANRDHLLSIAQGRFVKFVFDDDFLLPRSLELLHQAAVGFDAKLVFHSRFLVGPAGHTLGAPSALPAGAISPLDPSVVFTQLVASGQNVIGEPSNILLDAAALREMPHPFGLDGDRMRFLTDVALYVNLAHAGHRMAGIGASLSAFRVHPSQASSQGGPIFSAGLFEWELFTRWSADHGHIGPDDCRAAIERLWDQYSFHVDAFPELNAFLRGSSHPDGNGRFLSPEFRQAVVAGWQAIADRVRAPAVAA